MKKEENEARLARLKNIVLNMPEQPGSYQYYDAEGTIIYVGKAKNLKRRVSSYFHKEVDRYKTKVLVSKIQDITYTVVKTEEDALLLENALIKKYNPRYNILLKDGKTYPSICITNEFFPRIFQTRQINKKFGTYFGPFTNLGAMYTILDFIKKLYHPRTCRTTMTREGIAAGKYKPCLEYHIGNCGGCCIGKQTYEEYQEQMRQAREILKGNTRQLQRMIWDNMQNAAEEMRFEDAQRLKEQFFLVEQFCSKSEVVSHTITDVDVFTALEGAPPPNPSHGRGEMCLADDKEIKNNGNTKFNEEIEEFDYIDAKIAESSDKTLENEGENHISPLPAGGAGGGAVFVNYLHVTNGQINQSFTFEYKRQLDETAEEILEEAIPEIRSRFNSKAKEIIVERMLEWKCPGAEFFVPQRGDKAHLLELSLMNCKQYRVDRLKQSDKLNPEQRSTRLMLELQKLLQLPTLPMQIEAFDNSNIQGSDAVAGCVVFKKMKPSKQDYRKYNIKTVEGPDDYASMQEIVYRRYSRMIEENTPLPDLIVCDGGIGQMSSVREIIEDKLNLSIPIAGLAKDDKHRTNELLLIPLRDDTQPRQDRHPITVQIKPESELFKVLTQLQDEVHRYAITFHRDKRSKSALHSAFDDIKGIGPKTADILLKHFKSMKRLREATLDEIESLVGKSKAKIIYENCNTES